jgi:hypothetical protein
MSALGQKQTFALHQPMSALPPKADILCGERDVCLVPKGDVTRLVEKKEAANARRPLVALLGDC